MMVPITSPHRQNAQTLMNYYYDPSVAAQVAAYVNYVCPVAGCPGRDGEDRRGPGQEPVHLPDRRSYIKEKNIQGFRALAAQEDADYGAAWAKVVGN